MKATILDLRHKMKEILKALERNENVTLTHRGKEKGIITPVQKQDDAQKSSASHPAFGLWNEREETDNVGEYVRQLRKGRFDDL